MKNDSQTTVIGAGIVGICCALSLRQKGLSVRLIDRAAPGQGASYGNSGVISPWSFIPQAVPGVWKNIPGFLLRPDGPLSVEPSFWPRMIPWGLRFLARTSEQKFRSAVDAMETLTLPAVDLYRQHLEGTGQEDQVADSYYVHAFRKTGRANIDAIDYRIRKEKGADVQLIGAEELRQLEPALSPEFEAAILIKGQARAKSPGKIGETLAKKAVAGGVEIICDDVKSLLRNKDGDWNIVCDNETYSSDKIVVAAGAWSAELLKPLGFDFPLLAERGYHVEFPDPGLALENSVMDVDNKIVASSMEGGLRVAGTSEFAATDAPPDERRYQSLERLTKSMLSDLNPAGTKYWMGHRPSFPDSLPVLGALPNHEGLYGAFGHSHYGLMMAPKSGQLIADIVSGIIPNAEMSPYSAERFH